MIVRLHTKGCTQFCIISQNQKYILMETHLKKTRPLTYCICRQSVALSQHSAEASLIDCPEEDLCIKEHRGEICLRPDNRGWNYIRVSIDSFSLEEQRPFIMIVSEHGSRMIESSVEGFDVVQVKKLENISLSLSVWLSLFHSAMELFIK